MTDRGGREGKEKIEPGETYKGGQLGFITPIGPDAGEVYKTVDRVDATVGPTGDVEASIAPGKGLYDSLRSWVGGSTEGHFRQRDIHIADRVVLKKVSGVFID